MGSYEPSEEERKAYKWCIDHNILISPVCYTYGKSWKIDIIINGKSFKSPEPYPKIECWKKMYILMMKRVAYSKQNNMI